MSTHVGKIQELYDANSRKIYTRISPYTENTAVFSFGPKQPFIYTNILDSKSAFNKAKRFETRALPFASSLLDAKRISTFLATGNGIIFLSKQFFLQKNQAFNETRIYNPLSPILAASTKINPISEKYPSRFIDTSGGVIGTLSSLIGIPNQQVSAPEGTVGLGALTERNKSNAKGLIRSQTAISGYSKLDKSSKSGGSSFLTSLKSLFSIKPQKQPANANFRSDEGGYGIQLKPEDGKYDYFDKDGNPVKWGEDYYMRFEAGKRGGPAKVSIKKKGETSTTDSNRQKGILRIFGKNVPRKASYQGESVGYDERAFNGYIRYGQNVGKDRIAVEGSPSTYEFSDILAIYNLYTSPTNEVVRESKFNQKSDQSVKDIEDNLKRIINGIEKAGYKFSPKNRSDLFVKQFSNPRVSGLDELTNFTKHPNSRLSDENYDGSYGKDNKDNPYHIDLKKGFSGTNRSDRVNTLTILKKGNGVLSTADERLSVGDENRNYNPHRDDQIAFYFHDIVNDRYIPFRSTIKGLTENLDAEWSTVSYIGRADKVFNYTGFNRRIGFSFQVVAMSLKELLPMWVRINYLATLVKPSKYSSQIKVGNSELYDDFIVPPMTTLTVGDMYKEQPFVLKSVTINIPEDALWETTSETVDDSLDWSYLNDKIKFIGSGKLGMFAQFPRECDITITGDVLEKEQPRTGKANFGGTDSYKFSKNLSTVILK